METVEQQKIGIATISAGCLLIVFFLGLFTQIGLFIIPAFLIANYILISYYVKNEKRDLSLQKRIAVWIFLTLNLIFTYSIGATIPIMETAFALRLNMAYLLIPLLVIFNYIIFQRLQFYIEQDEEKEETNSEKGESENQVEIKSEGKNRPKQIIEFEGKKYIFSWNSIIILAVGAPLLSFLIYLFFDNPNNYWLHEIVVKQTTFFLNLIFDMDASVTYSPVGNYHWRFNIPGRGSIYFETFCTGIQAICVFAGIIICTPHSQDAKTNKDIIWRKSKSLIVSSVIFYVVNIIRMLIQLYLYYIGYAWADIHTSISAASSFIAAIIILLLHKWIPEFIISIIYIGNYIGKVIKERKGITEETKTKDSASILK